MARDVSTNLPKLRLLIFEPDPSRCDWLVSSLAKTGNFAGIIGSATISEAKQAADAGAFDIALISRETPEAGLQAYHLVQFFLTMAKPARSLMLAEDWRRSETVEAFRHGARGLLTGPISDMELLCTAITRVYLGEVWASSDQLNDALDFFAMQTAEEKSAASNAKNMLSAREQEVGKLLSKGASNREIADTLHISQRTVKNHLTRIFEKMGVTSRTQAALRLLE